MQTFDMTNSLSLTSSLHSGAVLTAPECPPVTMRVKAIAGKALGCFSQDIGEILISPIVWETDLCTVKGVIYHEYAHHLQYVHSLQDGDTGWGNKLDHPVQTQLFEKYKELCAGFYASVNPVEMAAEAFAALLVPHREKQSWSSDNEFLRDWLLFFLSQEGFKEFFPEGKDYCWFSQWLITLP